MQNTWVYLGCCLLLSSMSFAAEVNLRCAKTDFLKSPGSGHLSAYKDLARLEPRFKLWLAKVYKQQNDSTGKLRLTNCEIILPFEAISRPTEGHRTLQMYIDYFESGEFYRWGVKLVYHETPVQTDGLVIGKRKVEAFAECTSMEACIRMGIHQKSKNETKTSLKMPREEQ